MPAGVAGGPLHDAAGEKEKDKALTVDFSVRGPFKLTCYQAGFNTPNSSLLSSSSSSSSGKQPDITVYPIVLIKIKHDPGAKPAGVAGGKLLQLKKEMGISLLRC
jgi:hypothetical protein